VRTLAPGAAPERPYDVTGWTLPLQMGVKVERVDQVFEAPVLIRLEGRVSVLAGTLWGERRPSWFVIEARGTGGTLAANRLLAAGAAPSWTTSAIEANGFRYPPGSIVVSAKQKTRETIESLARDLGLRADGMKGSLPASLVPVGAPRVALYKPWTASIDEGWTRLLLEQYEFKVQTVSDADIRKGGLKGAFDVLVLPDLAPDQIVAGHKPETVPPEYAGGLGNDGVAAIRAFVDAGGTLAAIDSSSLFAIETFGLPVKDAVRGLKPEQFFCPGSLLRLTVDPASPLGFGLESEAAAFFASSSAFELLPAMSGDPAAASVAARYGTSDVLLSGWLEGEAAVAGRAAVLDIRRGAGRVVLLGFRVQHRGQSLGTFRLLFNAIHTTPAKIGRTGRE